MAHRAKALRQEGGDQGGFGRRLSFDPSAFTDAKRCMELLNVRSPFRLDLSRQLFDSFVVVGAPLHSNVLEQNQRLDPAVLYKYPEDLELPDGLENFAMPSGVRVTAISRRSSVSTVNHMLTGMGNMVTANGGGDESYVFQLANDFGPLYVAAVSTHEGVRDRPSFFPPEALVPDPNHRPLPPPPALAGCALTAPRVYLFVSRFPYFQLHFAVLHNILQQERWYKINNIIQQDSESPLAQILDPAQGGDDDVDASGSSVKTDAASSGAGSPQERPPLRHSESSALGRLKAKWHARKERKAREKAQQQGEYAHVAEAAEAVSTSDGSPEKEHKGKSPAQVQQARAAKAGGKEVQPSAGYSEDVTDARVSQLVREDGFELRGATPDDSSGFLRVTSTQHTEVDTPPEIRVLRQSIDKALAAEGSVASEGEGSDYLSATSQFDSGTSLCVSDTTSAGTRNRFASTAGDSGLLWTTDGLPSEVHAGMDTPDASTDTHNLTATEDITETEVTSVTEFTADDLSDGEDADLEGPLNTLRLSIDDTPPASGRGAGLEDIDQSFISLPKRAAPHVPAPEPPDANTSVNTDVAVSPVRRRSRRISKVNVDFELPPEHRDELTIFKRQSRDMFKRRPSTFVSPKEPSTVITTLAHYRTLKPPGPGESVKFNPMPGDGKPQFIEYAVPKGRDEQTLLAGWGVAATAKVLSREHLVHMLTAVLVEKRVVIVCPHLGVLSSIGTSIMSLLRPLKWEGIFVPILPQSMTDFLDAPVPFICGVQYLTDLPATVMEDEDFVIVDVVNDRVALPKKTMVSLPHRKVLDSALKPVHKHFSYGIKATIKKWNQRSKKKQYKTPYSVVSQQPQHMLDTEQQANVDSLMAVFHTYLVETVIPLDSLTPHVITDMNDPTHPVKMFMPDSFLDSCDKKTRAFYQQFCETQMFSSYFEEQIGNPVRRRERSGRRR